MVNPYVDEVLPIHPPPIDGECLSGYLLRLAEGNGITNSGELLKLCWPDPAVKEARRRIDLANLAQVACVARATAGTAERLTMANFTPIAHWFGVPNSTRAVATIFAGCVHPHLRYCPHCLAEAPIPFVHLPWRLALVNGCAIHGCRLCDQCGRCHQPIPMLRAPLRLLLCPTCNADVRAASTEPLTTSEWIRNYSRTEDLAFFLAQPTPATPRTVEDEQERRRRAVSLRTAYRVMRIEVARERGVRSCGWSMLVNYVACADMSSLSLRDWWARETGETLLPPSTRLIDLAAHWAMRRTHERQAPPVGQAPDRRRWWHACKKLLRCLLRATFR